MGHHMLDSITVGKVFISLKFTRINKRGFLPKKSTFSDRLIMLIFWKLISKLGPCITQRIFGRVLCEKTENGSKMDRFLYLKFSTK
jgi:hypothetical protein